MANVSKLAPKILQWEGGLSLNVHDSGNYDNKKNLIGSNKGIIPATFFNAFGHWPSKEEMANITEEQFQYILKKLFWDRWHADLINNQSIAEILVDWVWASGVWGIKIPQRILQIKEDGVVGNVTMAKVNESDQEILFNKIKEARIQFVNNIVEKNPSQAIFLKGWLRRINSFVFIK